MRNRLREALDAAGAFLRAAAVSVAGQSQEIVLVVGVVLVTVALWPSIERLALIVPGLVAVWMTLPTRVWFVVPGVLEKKPKAGEAR